MASFEEIQAQLDALKQGNADLATLISTETAEGAAIVAERDDLTNRLAASEAEVARLQALVDAGGMPAAQEDQVRDQIAALVTDQASLKAQIESIVAGTPVPPPPPPAP